jgi:protocatechuate 3,4-dioxygenase, alpha subunit
MSAEPKLIPSSSQTVGPYFRIGLESLVDPSSSIAGGTITIRGRVLDRDRTPVPDAMLELWTVAEPQAGSHPDLARGFRRVATDEDGSFSVTMPRPMLLPFEDRTVQAPHMIVLVFARGLLRQLISRVYLDGDPANDGDPVLLGVPHDRRRTLIAQADGVDAFRWDVILQGADETVFFAW